MSPDVQQKIESLPLQSKYPLCQYILSHSHGYIILKIIELCYEFHVVDVGFITAILQRNYSCRHQIIIQELVLET